MFLKSIGIDAPGVTVSSLEDLSIQRIHRALGLERLKPVVRSVDENGVEHRWTKPQLIQEFGFPVLSKEIASKIETLANPTEKNKTVRHAIVTGETGAYGGFQIWVLSATQLHFSIPDPLLLANLLMFLSKHQFHYLFLLVSFFVPPLNDIFKFITNKYLDSPEPHFRF